jgi:hypothetical protein
MAVDQIIIGNRKISSLSKQLTGMTTDITGTAGDEDFFHIVFDVISLKPKQKIVYRTHER